MSMLILVLCGYFFALRGNTEHADHEIKNVELGFYGPNEEFPGLEYIGITEVMTVARHSSVSASSACIERNAQSGLARLNALSVVVIY